MPRMRKALSERLTISTGEKVIPPSSLVAKLSWQPSSSEVIQATSTRDPTGTTRERGNRIVFRGASSAASEAGHHHRLRVQENPGSRLQKGGNRIAKLPVGDLARAPFNLVVRSVPESSRHCQYYHWYMSLVLRLSRPAGFELGSGMFINTALPEVSARFLNAQPEPPAESPTSWPQPRQSPASLASAWD